MELNKDNERRCEILGISGDFRYGGCQSFQDVTVEQLNQLVAENFADPNDGHNDAPSIAEFIEFMEAHDGFTVGGYAISPERNDYRVSIDSISYEGCMYDAETLMDFVSMFRYADEFRVGDGSMWAWFD